MQLQPHQAGALTERGDVDLVAGGELLQRGQPGLEIAPDIVQFVELPFVVFDLLPSGQVGGLGFGPGGLGPAPGGAGGPDRLAELLALAAEMAPGRLDEALAQADMLGDGDGVAFAGRADPQVVGRRERLGVELDRGVVDAVVIEGVGLQHAQVRGDHGQALAPAKLVERRLADRAAFIGVRAGAQFVQQDQASRVGLGENVAKALHVPAERRQRLLQRLLVADIDQHILEDPHRGAAPHGDVQAALGHHRQKRDRLEAHGLAAGVGSGDHEDVEVQAKPHVDRHDLVALLGRQAGLLLPPDLVDQQRVTGLGELQWALVGQLGAGHVELVGILGLGCDQVRPCDGAKRRGDGVGARGDGHGQLVEQAQDFGAFIVAQVHQVVVQFDARVGLDEHRRAGTGCAMHDARKPAAVLGPDRQNVSIVVQRDGRLLEQAANVRLVQVAVDYVMDLAAEGFDLAAEALQTRRGVVVDRRVRGHNPLDRVDLGVEVAHAAAYLLEPIQRLGQGEQVGLDRTGGLERCGQCGEVLGPGPAAGAGAGQRLGHVGHAAQRRQADIADRLDHLGGLVQPVADHIGIAGWPNVPGDAGAEAAATESRQDLAHRVVLDLV